ncbi:MAG: polysaccharide deacetylase family protein [Solirubrobacterales bacterium]
MDDYSPDRLQERRAEARRIRHMRRRRLLATLALLAVAALGVVAIAVRSGAGSSRPSSTAGESTRGPSRGSGSPHRHSQLVRNARAQPGWQRHTGPVPILVYHALGTAPPTEAYPGLYVSPREFREEMGWLARSGYQGVTLDEVEHAWYEHGTLPPKPIVITFDNGYPPQVRFAPSVLDKYGWPAVLFEITVEHLTPPYIRPIIAKGWEVDSHSATHPDLTTMSGAELAYQVAGSRRFLQRTYKVPSNNFCYPSSLYDSATIAAVRAAGYTGAVTEHPGYASRNRPYELNRYEIEGGQGVSGLASDLSSPG